MRRFHFIEVALPAINRRLNTTCSSFQQPEHSPRTSPQGTALGALARS
jgi:hypothetical protein